MHRRRARQRHAVELVEQRPVEALADGKRTPPADSLRGVKKVASPARPRCKQQIACSPQMTSQLSVIIEGLLPTPRAVAAPRATRPEPSCPQYRRRPIRGHVEFQHLRMFSIEDIRFLLKS